MPSALSIIGAATLLMIGGVGAWSYDRHAPLSWHAHVLLWHPGFDLPGGPIIVAGAQRDAALNASRIAQDGQNRCDASLATQSASVAQASALGATAMAQAQRRLDATKAQNARLAAAAQATTSFVPLPDQSAYQHWDQADATVLSALMEGR